MGERPVFWSFRRCPYAMRARLAVHYAGVPVELREILLRDKPQAFLNTSASATVPALQDGDLILDESLDIMVWALKQNDPDDWLDMPDEGWELIKQSDGPFKSALDRTKYGTRYPDADTSEERQKASDWLMTLNARLKVGGHLLGPKAKLCDAAILPFVRQFANIDRDWFDAQDWPHLTAWLDRFLESPRFAAIMPKYPVWSEGQPSVHFPEPKDAQCNS